jgi:hypothetical protein
VRFARFSKPADRFFSTSWRILDDAGGWFDVVTDPSEGATVREVAAVIYHFREALDSSLVMIVLTKSPVKPLPCLLLAMTNEPSGVKRSNVVTLGQT